MHLKGWPGPEILGIFYSNDDDKIAQDFKSNYDGFQHVKVVGKHDDDWCGPHVFVVVRPDLIDTFKASRVYHLSGDTQLPGHLTGEDGIFITPWTFVEIKEPLVLKKSVGLFTNEDDDHTASEAEPPNVIVCDSKDWCFFHYIGRWHTWDTVNDATH